jgi:hypothetical protein
LSSILNLDAVYSKRRWVIGVEPISSKNKRGYLKKFRFGPNYHPLSLVYVDGLFDRLVVVLGENRGCLDHQPALLARKNGDVRFEPGIHSGADRNQGNTASALKLEPAFLPLRHRCLVLEQDDLAVMPDVYATLEGRWSNCNVLRCTPNRTRTGLLELRYGKPQFGNDTSRFVETWQLSAGLEFDHALISSLDWMTAYGSLGLDWRAERLKGEGEELGGMTSESVNRFGLTGSTGLRVSPSAGKRFWSLLLQLGMTAWLPSSDGEIIFAGESETLQRAELAFGSGVLFRFL